KDVLSGKRFPVAYLRAPLATPRMLCATPDEYKGVQTKMMELHGLSSVSAIVPGCERIKVKKNVRALFAAAGLWLAFSMTANCRAGTLTEFEIKLPVFVPAPIKALSEHDVVLFVDRSASM